MSRTKQQIDRVIDKYGTNITHTTVTFSGFDDWGEPTQSGTSDETIKAVKDNNFIKQMTLMAAGRYKDGQASLIVKADVTVDERTSKITYGGQTYNIMQVEMLELSGEQLAQIIEIGLDSSN